MNEQSNQPPFVEEVCKRLESVLDSEQLSEEEKHEFARRALQILLQENFLEEIL